MISFFESKNHNIFAVQTNNSLTKDEINKLEWLFGNSTFLLKKIIKKNLIGPRAAMVSPWSTNAVEICHNMGIYSIKRIEKYILETNRLEDFDPMLNEKFNNLNQDIFTVNIIPEKITNIDNINQFNKDEGLSLSLDEVNYLEDVSKDISRKLTDSEIFGFSQVNSEHCRHKIFNGK